MSTFDTHWLHFEIAHDPQAPGAKEDALFWYKKGASDESKDIDTLKGEIEDLKHDLSFREGQIERALERLQPLRGRHDLEEVYDELANPTESTKP